MRLKQSIAMALKLSKFSLLSKRLIDRYAAVDGRHILAPDTADALYRRLDEDLAILRTAARQSMDALDADSAVPDPSDATNTTDADLGALRDEVLALATTLRAREADQRYALAAERMATLSTLQARRVALLPQLSPAERARWVASERWHPQQQSRTLADGSLELKLPYSDDRELLMDILKYGSDCEVLAPPALRARVREELQRAMAAYA